MAEGRRMTAAQAVDKLMSSEHADVIRESVRLVVAELMEAEVAAVVGAELGERAPERRTTQRNGYRERAWDTRVGELELAIPRLRSGPAYFPSFLEPRRRAEQALVAVVQEAYVNGVSTRKVDRVVEQLGVRMTKDQVSRLCPRLDEQVPVFRERPLEGAYPYLWLDAKQEKVRDRGHVVPKALVIAYGVHETGPARGDRPRRRRDRVRGVLARVPALAPPPRPRRRAPVRVRRARGPQERDRQGARLPVAALHGALRQRHAPALPPGAARARLRRAQEVFNADGHEPARERVSAVIEQLEPTAPKVAELLEAAEDDLLAFYRFPPEHWSKLRSTNPLERVNREIGRRTDVVGIFPNDASLIRLAGMLLIEQNDEWLVSRRYLSQESLAALAVPETELSGTADQETEQYQLEKEKETAKEVNALAA